MIVLAIDSLQAFGKSVAAALKVLDRKKAPLSQDTANTKAMVQEFKGAISAVITKNAIDTGIGKIGTKEDAQAWDEMVERRSSFLGNLGGVGELLFFDHKGMSAEMPLSPEGLLGLSTVFERARDEEAFSSMASKEFHPGLA